MTPGPVPASAGGTIATLEAFADAFNRHDADAIMALMTEDCVFTASGGPGVSGARYEGSAAVRAAFVEVWTMVPDARWEDARHLVCGDRGLSEWIFSGTRSDGLRVRVSGCDLFVFRGDRIAVKDSFRKQHPPLSLPGE